MQNELFPSVADLISQTLGVSREQITSEFAYGDVPEWDSMGHMNLMMALEEKYGVQITADTITRLVSIPAIIGYLLENPHA
jgi:acyl carrier protein